MPKISFVILALCLVSMFVACEYPKNDELVGKWEYDFLKLNEVPVQGKDIVTHVHQNACSAKKDFILFTSSGDYVSSTFASDCSDSLIFNGTWELNKKTLTVFVTPDSTFAAEVYKVTNERLLLKYSGKEANKGKDIIDAFERSAN